MKFSKGMVTGSLVLAAALAGCSPQSQEPSSTAAVIETPSAEVLLTEEPDGAQTVIAAREGSENDAEVTVVGRIGGSVNPWVDGAAAFSIVDGSLKACSDIPGDQCKTPWDYCCATDKLPGATALVKIVDDEQKVVKGDVRNWLGLKELQTVVVKGKAKRDDAGNLTILASGIYVQPTEAADAN